GAAAVRPLDLAAGPLAAALLVRLGEREHLALLTLHHIVADGWSIGVLLHDLAALYAPRGAAARGGAGLPPLPIPDADCALWPRRYRAGGVLAAEIEHWRRVLAGAPTTLALPTDRPRPAVPSRRGAARRVALAPEAAQALAALARQRDATLFMVL